MTAALGTAEEMLELVRQQGDHNREGGALNSVSQIHYAQGNCERALTYLNQSLAIQQEIGDSAGLCATLFNIGHIQWQNGE